MAVVVAAAGEVVDKQKARTVGGGGYRGVAFGATKRFDAGVVDGHAGSDVDSALYASGLKFGKRAALGVPGAKPLAQAMSKTLPNCALASLLYFAQATDLYR